MQCTNKHNTHLRKRYFTPNNQRLTSFRQVTTAWRITARALTHLICTMTMFISSSVCLSACCVCLCVSVSDCVCLCPCLSVSVHIFSLLSDQALFNYHFGKIADIYQCFDFHVCSFTMETARLMFHTGSCI